MLESFGAKVIFVPPGDFKGAIDMRNALVQSADHWSPMQFENEENIDCHCYTTAEEISKFMWLEKKTWSAFVSGAGTGGTIMGIKKYIENNAADVCVNLVVPAEKNHDIQGIGDGADYLVDRSKIDIVTVVSTEEAKLRARQFSKKYGILIGTSAAANIVAAERLEKSGNILGNIVTIICDRGERYLSNLMENSSEH